MILRNVIHVTSCIIGIDCNSDKKDLVAYKDPNNAEAIILLQKSKEVERYIGNDLEIKLADQLIKPLEVKEE